MPVVNPTIPTIQIGRQQAHYVIEWREYANTQQPKLLLARYGVLQPKVILTYELPGLDLRAFDADSAFRKRHALFRNSGEFKGLYDDLVRRGVLIPVRGADGQVSAGHITARICQFDQVFCLPYPNEDEED